MGGDAQPQILLQLAARLFHYGAVARARRCSAGRWALQRPVDRVRHVDAAGGPDGPVEGHAPEDWVDRARPTRPPGRSRARPYDSGFGHAHAIVVDDDGVPRRRRRPARPMVGAAAGR